MRASDVYALHVDEERYHQACEHLEWARRALPPGAAARAQLDAVCDRVAGEWRTLRETVARLHRIGPAGGMVECYPICVVPPFSLSCGRDPLDMASSRPEAPDACLVGLAGANSPLRCTTAPLGEPGRDPAANDAHRPASAAVPPIVAGFPAPGFLGGTAAPGPAANDDLPLAQAERARALHHPAKRRAVPAQDPGCLHRRIYGHAAATIARRAAGYRGEASDASPHHRGGIPRVPRLILD